MQQAFHGERQELPVNNDIRLSTLDADAVTMLRPHYIFFGYSAELNQPNPAIAD